MTAQKSSNPFDGLKIASEDSLNRSAKPKVTASKSEKQETDDINADLTTDDGADDINNFKDIPKDFLDDLTDIFDIQNITNFQAAVDFDTDILTNQLVAKGRKNELVQHLMRQWRKAMLEVIEKEKQIEAEIARKKLSRRPVWHCRACGRPSKPGCTVAPYISGYKDVDTGEVFRTLTE